VEFDDRDRHILALLQSDCRLSNAEVAEKVGMSSSACWRRIRQFEENGVIESYRAQLSPNRVGLEFQAIVHVQLARHSPEPVAEFIAAIKTRPEVLECYATTGRADYHLRVMCRNIAVYNSFLEEFLFRLHAVESAQTNVVLREIKRSNKIQV